jgi:ubiquinone/menaquinone biosynthesis C-methylase UbiE
MKTSKQFYTKLTAKGLKQRKTALHTASELKYIKKLLNKRQHILDLACGYGRFTIPLARQGYSIEGMDITPSLVKDAKAAAKREHLDIHFRIGDMRRLPYAKDSFDAIICTWNAFSELYKEADQLKAVNEMLRVLKKGGFAFIEMRYARVVPKIHTNKSVGDEAVRSGKRITTGKTAGIGSMPQYVHNKSTIRRIMGKARSRRYIAVIENFGGRERFLLRFWK